MTREELQACNTVRGWYCERCEKVAYATEALAAGALRLLRAKGRGSESFYHCQVCGMFHLTSRRTETNYRMEVPVFVQVGTTRIGVARKVKATGIEIGVSIVFTTADGTERNAVCDMSTEKARIVLDALTRALDEEGADD